MGSEKTASAPLPLPRQEPECRQPSRLEHKIPPDGNIVRPCTARAEMARVIPSFVIFRMRSPTYTHPPDDRAHSAQCLA
eukprot:2357200-Pyramimonas_sp.AAC.1